MKKLNLSETIKWVDGNDVLGQNGTPLIFANAIIEALGARFDKEVILSKLASFILAEKIQKNASEVTLNEVDLKLIAEKVGLYHDSFLVGLIYIKLEIDIYGKV